jgi:hypothetical protein
MGGEALFDGLLGEAGFASLDPGVQAVHGGRSGVWQGTATVQRGRSRLMRIAATLARLPASVREAPTTAHIDVSGGGEVWTRHFGHARPMRSELYASGGQLVERLGLLTMRFQLLARDRGVNWELQRIALLGVPLPSSWFQVHARAEGCERGYRFSVAARVVGLGELIRYDGQLQVPHDGDAEHEEFLVATDRRI